MFTAPGEHWGFGALCQGHLSRGIEGGESAGYYSLTNNPCRTWDSNPQPLDYKSDSLTTRPRLPNSLHLTHPKWTHPEQWAAMLQRPGSSWGFGALLKDTSVVVLKEDTPPPPTIPAGPEIRTHNLPLTSPTCYPLGHDCPNSLCNTHFFKHKQSKSHSNSSLTPHMCFTEHQPINKHTSTQLHMLDVFLFFHTVQYCIHNHKCLQLKKFGFKLAFVFTVNFSTSLCQLLSI